MTLVYCPKFLYLDCPPLFTFSSDIPSKKVPVLFTSLLWPSLKDLINNDPNNTFPFYVLHKFSENSWTTALLLINIACKVSQPMLESVKLLDHPMFTCTHE